MPLPRESLLRNCPFCNRRATIKDRYGLLTIECNHSPSCLIRGTIMPVYPQSGLGTLMMDWNGLYGDMDERKDDDLR